MIFLKEIFSKTIIRRNLKNNQTDDLDEGFSNGPVATTMTSPKRIRYMTKFKIKHTGWGEFSLREREVVTSPERGTRIYFELSLVFSLTIILSLG